VTAASRTIAEGARALGVALTAEQVEKLAQYSERVLRWNATHNLVSSADIPRFLPRHLLDSLSLVPYLRGASVLDLGTGAGLPGVPLAIAATSRHFVLLDRSERKLRFARQAVIELSLANAEIVVADAREYRPGRFFDTVVARAVMAPVELWRVARALLAADGVLIVQCGDPAALELPEGVTIGRHRIDIPGLDVPHWVLELNAASPVDLP
jgi:16S rRNA (guanine527-N7)-methyltransferase